MVFGRSLLRILFLRPQYRSRREKAGHVAWGAVAFLAICLPGIYLEWFDSKLGLFLWLVLGSTAVNIAGWLVWEFWGRRRFPLSAGDS